MGIVDKVREMAGGGGNRGFQYECEQCEASFTSRERNPSEVSCPECASGRVYSPV